MRLDGDAGRAFAFRAGVWVAAILPDHDNVGLARAVADFALIIRDICGEAAFESC